MTPTYAFAYLLAFALSLAFPAAAAAHPLGLRPHTFNGSGMPVTKGGVTAFTIRNHECSSVDYGDGRGENDCHNGNVRSNLSPHTARPGQGWSYSFEIRVPVPIAYPGFHNDWSIGYLTGAHDSRLRIASWEGNLLHNFIYMLKVDATRAVTFLDKVCVPPGALGAWHRFRLDVVWENDPGGRIEVSCDGKVLYAASGIATAENPHCYVTNECEPGVEKRPSQILAILGPVMQGFGPEWQRYGKPSQFTEFGGPVTVEFRNVDFRRLKK
ncbi:MAG: heparin lyase I family protein [Paracoccaceae bacterium]